MSRRGHVPLRRCVVCRATSPRGSLLRLAEVGPETWIFDRFQRCGRRGHYVCRNAACIQGLKKWKPPPVSEATIEEMLQSIHTRS